MLFVACFDAVADNPLPMTTNLNASRNSRPLSIKPSLSHDFKNANGDWLKILNGTNGKQGLYNSTKKRWVIQPQYSFSIYGFYIADKYGLGVAKDSYDRYGVFDTNGNIVISFNKYSWINPEILPGFLFMVDNMYGKCGIVDVDGQIICPFKFYDISTGYKIKTNYSKLSDILLVAKYSENGKKGLINITGKPVTDFIFDFINFDSAYLKNGQRYDSFACFKRGRKEFHVNEKWDVIYIVDYDRLPTYNQNITRNNNKNSDSSIKTAAAIGVFVGLAACIIDAISSSSSSSSSSSYSSSSSSSSRSYSSSSSSRSSNSSPSICSYCTGRGMMNCVWCYGRGIISGGWFSSDETCHWCKGQGRIWCYHCNGRGSR